MDKIRRVTIFEGENEYNEDEIDRDASLTELRDVMINRAGIGDFISKINKERGTLVITINDKRELLKIDLTGVSASLYFHFLNR